MSRIDPDPAAGPAPTETPPPRDATIAEVALAVISSFLGIRKSKAMQRDAVAIKPHQVIIVGIALAAVFVVTLLLLVRVIIRSATA